MIAKINKFSVLDGYRPTVGLLPSNCNVKLSLFFVLAHTNFVANNPKLTIQQYAKTSATTIFKHTSYRQKNQDKPNETTKVVLHHPYLT